ncbi:MAG: hypothetical protein COZ21_11760 [Bacteroidetes bacterium CG_4_10_14_3_um_filter_31_20]|nr:MAG: hypothetical protein COZ59_10935 [Bacteroidetes bacterium CG_4_8_14_3_um_filter_31_14]PIY02899.1 MAG: hypothetical protein COZ21_11760 [Bacteroidetes bacterium CG_4_10_14_3_um_filter_31_20]
MTFINCLLFKKVFSFEFMVHEHTVVIQLLYCFIVHCFTMYPEASGLFISMYFYFIIVHCLLFTVFFYFLLYTLYLIPLFIVLYEIRILRMYE